MIDIKNYESWFLLYADDELTAAEKLLVDDFLRSQPQLQGYFNAIQQIKFTPDENISFPDTSTLFSDQIILDEIKLEADQTIVYPFKELLYKRNEKRRIDWRIPFAIAASFLLLIGLFVFMNQEDELSSRKLLSNTIDKPVQIQPLTDTLHSNALSTSHRVKTRKTFQQLPKKLPEVSEPASSPVEPEYESIQAVPLSSPDPMSNVASNFTDEVIKAAESRINAMKNAEVETSSINTELIINASLRNENRTSLRGLIRKITRRVLKDDDESDQNRRIQVGSFAIPVSNKK